MASSSGEDRREEPPPSPPPPPPPVTYRTKVIHFFDRPTPIILQNDNGPCPLLSICNVLSLKNKLNLSPDGGDVSQETLLNLVAERLIDSNSNGNNKPHNIDDVIGLLHRLTTGIDVNIKFRRIGDFESTTERAIFDLLEIPLYHGWIVDPQDEDTVNAIGSKSYNTLMQELAALDNRNVGSEYNNKKKSEEDCIDFAAATTATLGLPSLCLSRGKSFEDSPRSLSDDHKPRKGDFEEEAELLRALKLSEAEMSTSADDLHGGNSNGHHLSVSNYNNGLISSETDTEEAVYLYSKNDHGNPSGQSNSEESGEQVCKDVVEKNHIVDPLVKSETALIDSSGQVPPSPCETRMHSNGGDELVDPQPTLRGEKNEAEDYSCSSVPNSELDSSSGRRNNVDVPKAVTSSGEGSNEPIYEGEECVLDSVTKTCEDREPMYESEVFLSEQVSKEGKVAFENTSSQDEITPEQGEVIRNFLDNSATQLTVYGLFCLQEDLKENELCVLFRNNHFNTMFKYDGQLYLLATDQGYINQPDLVWEKLYEVNGDTVFMTGDFKEFKIEENHANATSDERDAMGDTADHLASINGSDSNFNSDHELAMSLQQQEYDQQSQRNLQQQPTASSSSRMVKGPQVPRSSGKNSSSSSSSKPPAKSSKEKCILM